MEEIIIAGISLLVGGSATFGALKYRGRNRPVTTDQSRQTWPEYDPEIDKLSNSGLDRWNEYRKRRREWRGR